MDATIDSPEHAATSPTSADGSSTLSSSSPPSGSSKHPAEHGHKKLGEFASTAICGNDITSSCLYVSALAIGAAGKLAPIGLLIVAAMLFLFRKIYAEVVGALPLNGGAYNALLNTTSKARASVAACLTILSYMATAVISAGEAMHYGANLMPVLDENVAFAGITFKGTWWATIGLLAIFTGLTIMGISESASVAIGIFVTHLVTLTILIIAGVCYVFLSDNGMETLMANLHSPLKVHPVVEVKDVPEAAGYVARVTVLDENGAFVTAYDNSGNPLDKDAATSHGTTSHGGTESRGTEATGGEHDDTTEHATGDKSAGKHDKPKVRKRTSISMARALFFGFAVALLGISGFESSANFVEEQQAGVFPKTLRNMWFCVSVFNPAMAMLALALIPIADVQTNPKYELGLLAQMGYIAGGKASFGMTLKYLISIDAILVLSGAVLTSFVGVNGLVGRMTLDRCLPQFLLKTGSRGTTYRILISFFLLCVSVNWITRGDIPSLAGVYTISFLTVMTLFAIGNILLKVKRDKLPRPVRASWLSVFTAISAVTIGLVGNAIQDRQYIVMFSYYFVPAIAIVGIMLYRIPILKLCLSAVRAISAALIRPLRRAAKKVRGKIEQINSQQVVFFTRGDNVSNLNLAMQYVMENEDTNRIKVVTVIQDESEVSPKLVEDLRFLDEAYPQIDIEFVKRKGKFGPDLIQELSREWNVPTNLMFIGSPGGKLPYHLAELGGVRLII